MGKINVQTGNAGISLDADMNDLFLGFVKKILPEASKMMLENLKRIEENAVKQWPVRKPKIKRNSAGQVIFFEETTKKSYQQFVIGSRVHQDSIVVYLKNTAPYSYMIRIGRDSRNKSGQHILLPMKSRVAHELLVKPMNKTANKLVKLMRKELDGTM